MNTSTLRSLPQTKSNAAIQSVSVIGVGLMGQSIAALHLARGLHVTVADASEATAKAAFESILDRTRHFISDAFPALSRDALRSRLRVAGGDEEIAQADIVIEAIVENVRIKNRVLSRIAAHLLENAIIATNTSSLSVNDIAVAMPKPEQVCGWHFCHPVAERRLVEVVRARNTSEETIARVVQLAEKLGKRPLVVPDTPGFVVNRLLSPFLNEGLELLRDGVDAAEIEQAALDFGLPWGPLRQLDAIGIDICLRVGASLRKAYPGHIAESGLLVPLFEAGRFGNKCGAGILCDPEIELDAERISERFDSSSKATSVSKNETERSAAKRITLPRAVQEIFAKHRREIPGITRDDIRARLLLPVVIEATRILDEGLVSEADDIDAAVVDGLNFFAEQGGVLRWADSIGTAHVVEQLKHLERYGSRFAPTPMLHEMARTNAAFHK